MEQQPIDPRLDRARQAHRAGHVDDAERIYRTVLAETPDSALALHLLGVVAIQRGRPTDALQPISRSIELDPECLEARNSLAAALSAVGRLTEAVDALRAAVEIDSRFALGWRNIGAMLLRLGKPQQAEAALREAVALEPEGAEAHNDLGVALKRQGRASGEFVPHFERAHILDRGAPHPVLNLVGEAREVGDLDKIDRLRPFCREPGARLLAATALPAILGSAAEIDVLRTRYERVLDEVISAPPNIEDPLSEIGQVPQFYLAYHDRDERPLQSKLARALRGACPSLAFVAPHCRDGMWKPDRRLRIGFLSCHFRQHTIGKLQLGTIRGLPRDRFEVLVLAPAQAPDGMSRAIHAAADGSIALPFDLPSARQLIAEARLDLLFYPDIGMEPFSYFLSHARLAPVQVATWGHPVTPGTGAIDWFVSAASIEPPDGGSHYAERLALLTHPAINYARPASARQLDRDYFGLPAVGRIYLCPQTLFKFHPDFDELVAGTLRTDPSGIFVGIDGRSGWQARLKARIATSAPDIASRLHFVKSMPEADFLSLCALADVVLDIPNFSGGNTTLEALGAGTPVVHLPGRFMRGRLTGGLLRHAGLDWGIATSSADYIALATGIARDPGPWRKMVKQRAAALFGNAASIGELAAFLERSVEDARAGISAP